MAARQRSAFETRSRARRIVGATVTGLLIGLLALLSVAPAAAHTDLTATTPEDGEVLTESVTHIELEFSGALDTTGTSLRVLDSNGSVVLVEVVHVSETAIRIVSDAALDDGRFVVFWSVRSNSDGHDIDGSFSFEVLDPDSTNETDEGTTPDVDEGDGVGDEPEGESIATTTVPTTEPTTTTTAAPALAAASTASDDGGPWDPISWLGRWVTISGALIGIGALGFALTSLAGSAHEVRRAGRWIRFGGILLLVGSVVDLTASGMSQGETFLMAITPWTWIDAGSTTQAYATVLRLAGAVAMLQSPTFIAMTSGPPIADPVKVGGPAEATDERGSVATAVPDGSTAYRLEVQHEWLTIVGVIMVIVSFGLDGHTAGSGPVGLVASMTHVLTAGVWAGGVIVMADLLMHRRRSGIRTEAALVAFRFSRVAAVALALAAVAGVALAWVLVDTPSELWSGTWGRTLIAKVILAAAAAAIGGYNHFRVVPRLAGSETEETTLRRTVTIESVIVFAVAALTAVLVVAAP